MVSNTKLRFTIPYEPVAKARPRFVRISNKFVSTYSAPKTHQAETSIALLSGKYRLDKPIEGPIKLSVMFYIKRPKRIAKKKIYPITRPDTDNYIKLLLDALSLRNNFWKDDSQITIINAERRYTEDKPRIVVEMEELDPCVMQSSPLC